VKNELFVAALIIFIIGEEVIKKERTAFHKKPKKIGITEYCLK